MDADKTQLLFEGKGLLRYPKPVFKEAKDLSTDDTILFNKDWHRVQSVEPAVVGDRYKVMVDNIMGRSYYAHEEVIIGFV